jgi:hypothetical protein
MIAAPYGKSYQQVVFEITKLSIGPGRLSFDEYMALRLFDDAALCGADKYAFVGLDASRRIWATANHNLQWWGLMSNKLAVTTLLGGYGFPTIPTLALYSDRLRVRNAAMLREPADLLRFLRNPEVYPLFGKPVDSVRSLGSVGLEGYDAETDSVIALNGRKLPLEAFVAEVARDFQAGYMLQPRVAPHSAVRALVGERLATVRVVTICTTEGPKLLRAAWKIPAGSNVADNFWRSGNLLATLDLNSGRVTRVVRGAGLAQQEIARHPDSGGELIGFEIPNWSQIIGVALEAAATLHEVPLIGWDMAATEDGAVIVEPNFTPDFDLAQLADRRGILDDQFKAFLADCQLARRAAKKKLRTVYRAETSDRIARLRQSIMGAA